MKTPDQVREHLASLAAANRRPCCCRGRHAADCASGRVMIAAVIDALGWVLADGPVGYDGLVEDLARARRASR